MTDMVISTHGCTAITRMSHSLIWDLTQWTLGMFSSRDGWVKNRSMNNRKSRYVNLSYPVVLCLRKITIIMKNYYDIA